jgi:hypothetical protein
MKDSTRTKIYDIAKMRRSPGEASFLPRRKLQDYICILLAMAKDHHIPGLSHENL